MSRGTADELIAGLADGVRCNAFNAFDLVSGGEIPVFEKYDDYVPADLLRHAYATDKLNLDEAQKRILEIEEEMLDNG